jgi:hypothetical protein
MNKLVLQSKQVGEALTQGNKNEVQELLRKDLLSILTHLQRQEEAATFISFNIDEEMKITFNCQACKKIQFVL